MKVIWLRVLYVLMVLHVLMILRRIRGWPWVTYRSENKSVQNVDLCTGRWRDLVQYVGICGNMLLQLQVCAGLQWAYLPNGSAQWRIIANAVLNLTVPPHKVGCRRSRNSCDASSDPIIRLWGWGGGSLEFTIEGILLILMYGADCTC